MAGGGQSVSVVIPSRERPAELARCLRGVAQLDHDRFEVVLVSDRAGQEVAEALGLAGRIKMVPFADENVSAARNAGVSAAAGEIVAFVDDDAVPEPRWLEHLAGAIERLGADAAAGYVRGRNGISFQSRAVAVTALGVDVALRVPGDAARLVAPPAGCAIKTVGTNCAFRRSVLVALGGFDPGFSFFMDETDLDLRLAARGGRVAVVPLAEVHHGFAPSRRRRRDRMPLDLSDIGRSSARLLRRHAPGADPDERWREIRAEQRARLLRHMVAGGCEPGDVERLLATLARGWEEGMAAPLDDGPWLADAAPPPFRPLRAEPGWSGHRVFFGPPRAAARLRREAAAAVREGSRASLFLLGASLRRHRVAFTDAGVWEQVGGVFAPSERSDPPFRPWRLRERVERELARLGAVRLPPGEEHVK